MKELQRRIQRMLSRFFTYEILCYAIAGGLTTFVNFISYHVLCNIFMISNMRSNTIAWVIAVAFAYFVNNYWVFQDKNNTIIKSTRKLILFFGARLITFAVESAGMYFFIDVLGLYAYNLYVKGVIAMIVILLNYVLSKWLIFKKK